MIIIKYLRVITLQSVVTVAVAGCSASSNVGEAKKGVSGCLAPPASNVSYGGKLEARATLQKLGFEADGSAEYEEKIKQLNAIPSVVYKFQHVIYTLCVSIKDGIITEEQHQEFFRKAFNDIYKETIPSTTKTSTAKADSRGLAATNSEKADNLSPLKAISKYCLSLGEGAKAGQRPGIHDRLIVAKGPGPVKITMTSGGGNVWLAGESNVKEKEPYAVKRAQELGLVKTLSAKSTVHPQEWQLKLIDGQYVRYRSTHSSAFVIAVNQKMDSAFLCQSLDR